MAGVNKMHSVGGKDDLPVRIPPKDLFAFVKLIFKTFGSSEKEQDVVAHHIVQANLTGHDSHGVILLPMYRAALGTGRYEPNIPLSRMPKQHKDSHIVVCDGFTTKESGKKVRGFGQRLFREAIELGCDEAKRSGLSMVSFREGGHIGRMGTYGELIASKGLCAILMAAVSDHEPLVAVHAGATPVCCTNPLCITFPTDKGPFLLDFATSRVSFGKIKNMIAKGLPEVDAGLFIDKDGKPSQDPLVMLSQTPGALLPFGDHKGSGLMVAIEVLAGALTSGATTHPDYEMNSTPDDKAPCNSALAFIFDVDKLHGDKQMANKFLDYVRNSPRADPSVPIYIPGDVEKITREERTRLGIPLPLSVWNNLMDLARSIKIPESELQKYLDIPTAAMSRL